MGARSTWPFSLQLADVSLNTDEQNELKSRFGTDVSVTLMDVSAKKPNYEVGASSQLKLSFAQTAPGESRRPPPCSRSDTCSASFASMLGLSDTCTSLTGSVLVGLSQFLRQHLNQSLKPFFLVPVGPSDPLQRTLGSGGQRRVCFYTLTLTPPPSTR